MSPASFWRTLEELGDPDPPVNRHRSVNAEAGESGPLARLPEWSARTFACNVFLLAFVSAVAGWEWLVRHAAGNRKEKLL